MGHAANKSKARKCRDCQQSIHGTAADIREHAATCKRLSDLNLVVPGLLSGQEAVKTLQAAITKKRNRPRWG